MEEALGNAMQRQEGGNEVRIFDDTNMVTWWGKILEVAEFPKMII